MCPGGIILRLGIKLLDMVHSSWFIVRLTYNRGSTLNTQ